MHDVTESDTVQPVSPLHNELPRENSARLVEIGPKVGATSLAVLYVLGLIAVNTYLSKFGFAEYSLVKGQYLFVGAWVAVPLILSTLPILSAMFQFGAPSGKRADEHIEPALRALFLVAIPFTGWILVFHGLERSITSWGNSWANACIDSLFLCAVLLLLVFGAVGFLIACRPAIKSQGRYLPLDRFASIALSGAGLISGLIGLIVFVVSLFTIVWTFANFFYDRIPREIGGGRPARVRLLLKTESSESLRSLGLELPPDSRISLPVDILVQTDKLLYIRTGSGSILQLNGETVTGMRIKARPDGSGAAAYWELEEVEEWEAKLNQQLNLVKDQLVKQKLEHRRNEIFKNAKIPSSSSHERITDDDWQCGSICSGVVGQLHDEYLTALRSSDPVK